MTGILPNLNFTLHAANETSDAYSDNESLSLHNSNTAFSATVEQLTIMGLVVSSIFVSLLFKRFNRISRFVNEFSVSILLGLVVGLIIMAANWTLDKETISISPTVLWNIIVPFIVFESGFNMSRSLFFKNFSPILLLSFFGTVIASLLTAVIVFGLMSTTSNPMSFLESMTFGALISATDPASILATITGIPVNPNVGMIIFGESAVNNAVALILYRATLAFARADLKFTVSQFFATCGLVLWMFIASILIGVGCALVIALILRHINIGHHGWTLETVMVLIFAYSSYLLAELIQYSGIVSILFCGMTMATYLYPNMSLKSRESAKNVVHVLSFVCQTSLYLYIGLGVSAFKPSQRTFDVAYVFIALFAIMVARLHVFVILPMTNLWKRASRTRFKHMLLVFLSGLRGGIAFVMAVDLGENYYYASGFKESTMGTVLILILLTTLIMGGVAPVLIKVLGLEADNESELLNGDEEFSPSVRQPAQGVDQAHGPQDGDELPENSKRSKLQLRRKDLLSFDKKFIRPFFSKPSDDEDTREEESKMGKRGSNEDSIPLKSVSADAPTKPTFFVGEEEEEEA